jgi:hypothetical protein
MSVPRETESFQQRMAVQIAQRKAGMRGKVQHGGTLCSSCLEKPPVKGQRYCAECRNDYKAEYEYRQRKALKKLREQHSDGAGNNSGA